MTEQVTIDDIAGMLMSDGNTPDLEETTGAADEPMEQAEETEAYELEAEVDGVDDEADETDDSDEPEYFRVKVDGEELEVTLEEALAGYQRDSDYRKKTMAVAETRKEIEARGAEIDAKLQELDSFIKREETELTEDLMRTNPGEYLAKKAELDKAKDVAAKAQEQRNAELMEQRKTIVADETRKLTDAMGGEAWTTDQRNSDFKLAGEYLAKMGITEAEQKGIVDHRVWRMIFDAAKANQYAQTQGKVKEQVRKAPKSVKPGQKVPASERKRAAAAKKLSQANKHNAVDLLADYISL